MKIWVKDLFYYPLKSGRAEAVQEAQLGPRGIVGDREFMAVYDDEGIFSMIRQAGNEVRKPRAGEPKEFACMARISAQKQGGQVCFEANGTQGIKLDLPSPADVMREVKMFQGSVQVMDLGRIAAQWISAALGVKARLVWQAPWCHRLANQKYAGLLDEVSLADGAPFLLTSESSRLDLSARMQTDVAMSRFRPNIVIAGNDLPAWFEDQILHLCIGGRINLELRWISKRCPIPEINQELGVMQPLRLTPALQFRMFDGKPTFGWNALYTMGFPGEGAVIRVGEAVEVLAIRKPPQFG